MRKLIYVLLGAQIIFWCQESHAQNYSVYNSYYLNPSLYNPAEVCTEYTFVFLNHRQQWMGIDGSPVVTTANFSTMLNESRAGIGAKVSSYKRGIITSTDIMLTYAYGIPISQKNTLYFGLSGGAITNKINADPDDLDDPALINYQANNFQPASNFGMLYRSAAGLNFGVVLPQLFAPKFNLGSFENTSPSPFDNIIVSTYYKRKVEGKIVSRSKKGVRRKVKTQESSAPLEFYLLYKYSKIGTSQFEAMAKLNLSDNFWLGAAYRQAYGFTGSLGFTYNRFLFAYSFEPGNQPEPTFSTGTHEIQLGLRLGEAKKFKRRAPVLRSTLKTTNEQHMARFQQTVEDPDHDEEQQKNQKKYYVVVKAFPDFTAADAYKKKLIEQKYNANVFYYAVDKRYYVHVLESSKQSEANEEARNLKNYTKLKDARVLIVTIKQ
jgi:type IX secretion system PorP/SprF family membrane protein